METTKRVQKIAPTHSYTSPSTSSAGSTVTVRDRDSPSILSIPSGSHVMSSFLVEKAAKKVTRLICKRCTNAILSLIVLVFRLPFNHRITYGQRTEMVNVELRELQKEVRNLEKTSRKKRIYLRVQMEESESSIREIYKARKEFEDNVVQKGVDIITGKIPAEKFIRSYDKKIHSYK